MLPYLLLTALQLLSCQGRPLDAREPDETSCSEVQTVNPQIFHTLLEEDVSLSASSYPTVVSTRNKTWRAQNGNLHLAGHNSTPKCNLSDHCHSNHKCSANRNCPNSANAPSQWRHSRLRPDESRNRRPQPPKPTHNQRYLRSHEPDLDCVNNGHQTPIVQAGCTLDQHLSAHCYSCSSISDSPTE